MEPTNPTRPSQPSSNGGDGQQLQQPKSSRPYGRMAHPLPRLAATSGEGSFPPARTVNASLPPSAARSSPDGAMPKQLDASARPPMPESSDSQGPWMSSAEMIERDGRDMQEPPKKQRALAVPPNGPPSARFVSGPTPQPAPHLPRSSPDGGGHVSAPSLPPRPSPPNPPRSTDSMQRPSISAPYNNRVNYAATPPAFAPVEREPRELRVEDALLYLDRVKSEFRDRPHIYNEFLAIMKNFRSHQVDTPGVIEQVSKLFRGYNDLILGFNTFLPEGFKISLSDLHQKEAMERAAAASRTAREDSSPSHDDAEPPHGPEARAQEARASSAKNVEVAPSRPPRAPVAVAAVPPPPQPQPPSMTVASPSPPKKARPAPQPPNIEFDHAISYVTTIKRRFAHDPSTYHSFLEILHTYQREQRGIKEVLEQVATLFQDHPDLLKEFTFFLPDAVQEQAKERLHRAAAESESRQAAQRQQQMEQYQQQQQQQQQQQPPPQQQQPQQQTATRPATNHQKFIDMTRNQVAEPATKKRTVEAVSTTLQPESYVYNSAVERQFFDAAKEALTAYTRDGGQAWAEFMKCLDMFAQEILSRSEMLNFVEPLLGKRNSKLFEEFKRILNAAGSPSGSTPPMEDSWYSVPLSEIDFSRCRRCTPSYRALPRDYPAPPCSDRNADEIKVLNDVWVSLPVGSEESYTFRHMRRNTYEETLFRVEDERFEIDMVIDSNAATLRRLEPIAEEIAQLSRQDPVPSDLGLSTSTNNAAAADGVGLGGKRFQYSFDKKVLGVIQRNTVARIYGDAGQEMLDLMVKNPTVAIPLIVQRLRQKDEEWRAVRERLNKSWKELSEINYYKSLDHRGLTWRTTDKRATSSRTLLAEIKDRAANGGKESKDAIRQKMEKAKEEHGSFFEVTMVDTLYTDLDLTPLPKPDRRLFTPHLSILYPSNSWTQRDAYRILSFALERGPISPSDKERCHRLWVEFFGPWFGLSLNWMHSPAVTYQESTVVNKTSIPNKIEATVVSEDDDEDSMEEDSNDVGGNVVTEELRQLPVTVSKGKEVPDHHPLPPGARVSTLYGEGVVVLFRNNDHIYVVDLAFGRGYLRPSSVLCSILPVEKSAYTRQLRADDRTKLARPGDQLVIGTQSLYLFFRLHHILIQRLTTAKRLAYTVGEDQSLSTLVEQMPDTNPSAVGRRRYEAYLSLLYALLDGGVGGAAEGGKYEDRVRTLLGHGGYELATMDKLISHIWKNIQTMAGDETMWNLVQLYRRHYDAGSFQPEAFRQEAAYLADGEAMYAFQSCPIAGTDDSVLHMEYLGVMDEDDDDGEVADAVMEVEVAAVPEPSQKRQRR